MIGWTIRDRSSLGRMRSYAVDAVCIEGDAIESGTRGTSKATQSRPAGSTAASDRGSLERRRRGVSASAGRPAAASHRSRALPLASGRSTSRRASVAFFIGSSAADKRREHLAEVRVMADQDDVARIAVGAEQVVDRVERQSASQPVVDRDLHAQTLADELLPSDGRGPSAT